MADRPMLFSGPMVRALLEGHKTQTRRVLKIRGHKVFSEFGPSDTKGYDWHFRDAAKRWHDLRDSDLRPRLEYAPGDRLWVREKWQGLSFGDYQPTKDRVCCLRYAATDGLADLDTETRGYPWRPSIHMPRWASRLTLLVTEVRVQRLQDISGQDAVAEGVRSRLPENGIAQQDFFDLWNRLHGPGAVYLNPWVCALTFTVSRKNIDTLQKELRNG